MNSAATLVSRRPAGAYHALTIAAPRIVEAARPGQFVSIGIEAPGTLLRRPFAVAGVDAGAGTIEVVVAAVGRGTAWLVSRPTSTPLEVVGPLGTAFSVPDAPARHLLVGGGYGVAPLEWLASRVADAGHDVDLLTGARTAAALYPTRVAGAAITVVEATEDGSRGHAGLVTDVLADRLADGGGDRPTVVRACGPMPMLAAVARVAADAGVACEVAVEEHMACSVGVCMTCVVPATDGYVRACIDGPVLDAARIRWPQVLQRHSGPDSTGERP